MIEEKFGAEGGAKYVNGVLDKVAKNIRPDAAGGCHSCEGRNPVRYKTFSFAERLINNVYDYLTGFPPSVCSSLLIVLGLLLTLKSRIVLMGYLGR